MTVRETVLICARDMDIVPIVDILDIFESVSYVFSIRGQVRIPLSPPCY
jgi:hypothetical protein